MDTPYESSVTEAAAIRDLARQVASGHGGVHAGSPRHGWVLGTVVDEGARDFRYGPSSWEAGSVYVLRADGALMWSPFWVSSPSVPLDVDVVSALDRELQPLPDSKLSDLDRPNLADYEISHRDEAGVRFELGRRYQVVAQARGEMIVRALRAVDTPARTLDNTTVRRRARQAARSNRRERPLRILGTTLGLLLLAVPVWALTPVVAYVMASMFPGLYPTFFWAGKNREGDLYVLLAMLLPSMVLGLGAIGLALPYRDGEEVISPAAITGFAGGLVVLLYQACSGTGGQFSWFWPPLSAMVAHLGLGIHRRLRNR
ncbi:hypothetical protein [Nocardia caishijiensis]|uniref:Uncharacterized protein n=1 Tax=Nocardia caishijiensis TaxID=184756 RepID=A0ABQ6YIH2_9NOCA|nr:hypothetical protein [Nocardia caishijiensis]KAF0845299.1 hypothetical protein FNL39_108107 [Nocardia caishijiensis]